jgi:PAS domain S-box-containing protein
MTTRLVTPFLNVIERSAPRRYMIALLAVLISILLRMSLTPLWGPTALPFLFFYPTIVLAAWIGRLRTAVFAIVLSAFAADYFFFEPAYGILSLRLDEIVGILSYVVVCLCIAAAIHRMHRASDQLKEVLEQSEQNESLFRVLLNNSRQSVWHYRSGSVPIAQFDRAGAAWWCEFTGQTEEKRDANEGMGWLDAVHPDDQTTARNAWTKITIATESVAVCYRVRRKDGQWRWLSVYGVPVRKSVEHEVVGTVTDVTERRLEEEATRQNEAELQLIMSQTPFMLTRCSADLRYLFVSPAYAEMLGRPAADIAGKSILEVMGQDGFATILPHIKKVLKGETVEYQTEVTFQSVGPRTLHVVYGPEINERGDVIGWIASIRDLTDSKRTENSLAESLRREQVLFRFVDRLHRAESDTVVYEAALDSIFDGLRCNRASILLFDEAGMMRFVASRGLSDEYVHAVEGHSPWQPDNFDAQPISISDLATADLDESLRTTIKKEGIQALNFIPLVAGRKLIGKFMFYYNVPHVCSSEELELSVNIGRQLAFSIARKRTDDALKENEERLRLATQTGKVGIWDWNITLNRLLWTDSLYEIHGVEKEQFDGTVDAFAALVHPEDKERVATAIACAVNQREPCELEFRVIKPNGETTWVFTSAVALHDGTATRMLGATLDITERKKNEAERETLLAREHQLRELAEESNRLKDEFLAIMSHELRNPLNVIVGYSELLVRTNEIAASPYLLRMTDAIKRNANTQAKLIRDLVDLSRLRSGKLELNREVVSLLNCVNHAVDTIRDEADEKKIAIVVKASDDSVLVNADPIRLQQIIWNLLNNSVKFTPAGGNIAVSIGVSNGDAALIVKDDGQGIDPAFLPHVFEIFRQADSGTTRAQSGMGVGLAVVKQLVELHGGAVSVTSDGPGQGSEFRVTLPISKQAPLALSSSTDLSGLDNLKVLILDDSEDTVEMLKILLAQSGASVVAATAGSEALRIAAESDFDVIVSDISMPGMDGFEFLRNLKSSSRNASVPVFALTGFGRAEDIERARAAGFYIQLTKPLDLDRLLETLRHAPRRI